METPNESQFTWAAFTKQQDIGTQMDVVHPSQNQDPGL